MTPILRRFLPLVFAFALATLFCTSTPPATPTPDVSAIVAQTLAALTAQVPPTAPPPTSAPPTARPPTPTAPPPPPATGSIAGSLSYPSEFIPPLRVVAFNVATGQAYYVDTAENQGTFQIDNLPPGTYHVVAYVLGGTGLPAGFGGGYTRAVPCGLSIECNDHTLIEVTVTAGQVTQDVRPWDWYAPEGAFPPMP